MPGLNMSLQPWPRIYRLAGGDAPGVGPGDPFLVMVVVSTRACPLQGRHAMLGSSIPTQLQ
jgi:hypothetical protein